ncbi:MAG: YceI family protein [Pseudomonadota bacterium]
MSKSRKAPYAAALMILAPIWLVCACAPREASKPGAAPQSAAPEKIEPVSTDAPAGEYKLDKSHASLVFQVNHIGYSQYTGQFKSFDAALFFDPKAPENMTVSATIDVRSLDIPSPPEGFLDELKSPAWLNAVEFPAMNFRSTKVTLTGPNAARINGELSFRGVTAPVALDAVFNGGYSGFPPHDPAARIGFSAKGSLKRSVFGVLIGIPSAENPVGVSDDVSFEIEAEFNGPPSPAPQ